MLSIQNCSFTAIDFESAGASSGKTDTPVQIGLAKWTLTQGITDPFVSYLHTTEPIQWSAQKIHGIGPNDLIDAPSLLSLWPTLKQYMANSIVVAHGKGTEKRFLRSFPGHGFGPWIDTLLLSRAAWPHAKKHALGDLCNDFQLTPLIQSAVPDKSWHDALFDSVASLVLLEFLIQQFELADCPIDWLIHPNTSTWHRLKRL